jgi:hypothetical protein
MKFGLFSYYSFIWDLSASFMKVEIPTTMILIQRFIEII